MNYNDIIENLKAVNFTDCGSSHTYVEAVTEAIYKPEYGRTRTAGEILRQRLIAMASDAKAYYDMDAYVERLHEAADSRDDITVKNVEYMPCPLDANGKAIHLGDRVMVRGKVGIAHAMTCSDVWLLYDDDYSDMVRFGDVRHCDEPTVMGVIEELLAEWPDCENERQERDLKRRIADRLQLKVHEQGEEQR